MDNYDLENLKKRNIRNLMEENGMTPDDYQALAEKLKTSKAYAYNLLKDFERGREKDTAKPIGKNAAKKIAAAFGVSEDRIINLSAYREKKEAQHLSAEVMSEIGDLIEELVPALNKRAQKGAGRQVLLNIVKNYVITEIENIELMAEQQVIKGEIEKKREPRKKQK